ncbi:DNA topoisomerase IV, A subunit [Candidatus Endolissoclinum faulkneri L5]|uniref:DNA topoisomerase 4 subunit A n=1 Tax=Candidatus Endolissoclinum faulkneri L5 TaxID=1401328 RepID=V9TUX9_9PROT|nr:DNA topoisomerase IV subunit A [Candidatus Endolissoclinum faulkneri]AHC73967.1 DNA topoisomerase IV, A subunit [Candidatus Endolissoclinum faulkneri L5]
MSMPFSLLPTPPQQPSQAEVIHDTWLADALSERYLAYALSTIMARSLPDVRDGLKPVHRRLLFAMRKLKLSPDRGFKKSARVIGDVMGKFHPHGDAAIYDAMVRLARDFAVRYPLIDGHGNFGNVDGDNAAAMRYTEARLTEVGQLLMAEIDEDTVDFRATYDAEGKEPVVFPAAFPNLLANGSQGIAVGMATSIPPHNLDEVCEALQCLIKNWDAGIEILLEKLTGPDFPTGGILVESRETLQNAYRIGKGSFRLRARWNVERLKNGTWQVAITEIPYQVQKSRLIERIAELLHARRLAFLGEIRDESANDVRVVLEPKNRNVDPAVLMESLFKQTELQIKVMLNLNVLDKDNIPRVMGMSEALKAFLNHRHEVLIRKTKHRLNNIAHRLEILVGYQIAFFNMDQIILIIQEKKEPKAELMRKFHLTEGQSEAIMDMRLRSLRKLEEIKSRQEHEQLSIERDNLIDLLANEKRRWQIISEQLSQIKRKFGKSTEIGRRRTDIVPALPILTIPNEAMIEREPITVICSEKVWIRALRGSIDLDQEVKYKEGDSERFRFHAETTDKIILFATDGRFYTICGDKLPSGRGHGEPVRLIIDLANDDDIVAIFPHRSGEKLLVASTDGRGFIVASDEVLAQTRAGKQVLGIDEDSKALVCIPVSGDTVAVIGTNRKMLIFDVNNLPEMSRGKGVILQSYKSGDSMADLIVFNAKEGMSWPIKSGFIYPENDLATWRGKRATAGKLLPSYLPLPARYNSLA